jgi:hypothetical protein
MPVTINSKSSPEEDGEEDPNTFPGLPNVGEPPKVGAPPNVLDTPKPDAPRSNTGEPPNPPVQNPYVTKVMVCCGNSYVLIQMTSRNQIYSIINEKTFQQTQNQHRPAILKCRHIYYLMWP